MKIILGLVSAFALTACGSLPQAVRDAIGESCADEVQEAIDSCSVESQTDVVKGLADILQQTQ